MDEHTLSEQTIYNIRADFRESDYDFRKRMNLLVPSDMAMRIEQILTRRLKEKDKDEDRTAS